MRGLEVLVEEISDWTWRGSETTASWVLGKVTTFVALFLSPTSSWLCFFGGKKNGGSWKLKLKLGKKGIKGFLGDSEAEDDSVVIWVVLLVIFGIDFSMQRRRWQWRGKRNLVFELLCYAMLCNFKSFIGRVTAQPPRHSLSPLLFHHTSFFIIYFNFIYSKIMLYLVFIKN